MVPSVWGHDSIKQAVLLMLFGGVHKVRAACKCVCVCARVCV